MVTQIIAVRHANAAQLIQNLQPLIPEYARDSFSANESGNSLLLTATKTDVRRVVEIVKALDDSISATSGLRVFPLKYADAKALATAVKELFTQQTSQQGQGGRGGGQGGFGGLVAADLAASAAAGPEALAVVVATTAGAGDAARAGLRPSR